MKLRKILRRTLWTIIVLATVISLFYAEEDWRGARALRAAEKEYQQAGISLRFSDYIPKPIPDSENLGALPIFTLTYLSPEQAYRYPQALVSALRNDQGLPPLPSMGHWQLGEQTDFAQIDFGIARIYLRIFKATSPASPLAQLDALFPLLQTLRQASLTRTQCRFDSDFRADPPQGRSLSLLTAQIRLSQLLALHGLLALQERQPDVSLEDVHTILLLAKGASCDPSLIGSLVAAAIRTFGDTIIFNGLAEHAWSLTQLEQLQDNLARDSFLFSFPFGLETEAAGYVRLSHYIQKNPVASIKLITGISPAGMHPDQESRVDSIAQGLIAYLFPNGWINLNEGHLLEFFHKMISLPDTGNLTISPARTRKLFDDLTADRIGPAFMPWNFLAFTASKPLEDTPRHFALGQTLINESVIACAIERYRLFNGRYPESIDVLTPSPGKRLPRDVINGQPYHYRVNSDGSYLLYSVGWNEKDDGGKVVFDKDDPQHHRPDYTQGDWVWFGPK